MTIRIALVGFGKIARDQHLPAILADPQFELVAVTSRNTEPNIDQPALPDLSALLEAFPTGLDAVAICTPPEARHSLARLALGAGLAVLLEKPPATTLGEVEDLILYAQACACTLYGGWHSQHAPAVKIAAGLLRGASVRRMHITWHEDVRKWHAGQDWIWDPGGFGVFDPGINALSIATAILPNRLIVRAAQFEIPENRQSPIAAALMFAAPAHTASFDWRNTEGENWTIEIETDNGRVIDLQNGGARLLVDGEEQPVAQNGEYPSIYSRFAELITTGRSEVDTEPLRIVADAFLVGGRTPAAPFLWTDKT